MNIKPLKNYKKPLYAIGLTTAIMALSLTGCTDPIGEETTVPESIRQEVVESITAGIVYIHTK